MKTMQIVPRDNPGYIEYSFNSDNAEIGFGFIYKNNQIKRWHGCRGYVIEFLYSHIYRKYHFNGAAAEVPEKVSVRDFDLMVISNLDYVGPLIPQVEDFFHQIEDSLGFNRTEFVNISNYAKGNAWVLKRDKRWMNSPFMISLYCFLLRAVALKVHKIGKTYQESIKDYYDNGHPDKVHYGEFYNDLNRISSSYEFIMKVLKYGPNRFFYREYKKNFFELIHAQSYGFCSMSSKEYDYRCLFDNNSVYDVLGNPDNLYKDKIAGYYNYIHRYTDEQLESMVKK